MVSEPNGWFSSCYNCWGDWSAHLTYTSSFAFSQNWPPQLPVFLNHKFTYPFFIDLLSAGLVRLGFSLPDALILPGFILSLVLTFLIYLFARATTNSRLAAIFSVVLFFGSAGFKSDTRWLNFITSQLIPQRGILLGLSLSIIVYLFLWKKKPLAAGIVAGLLPLIHAHSYLVTLFIGFFYGWKFLVPALFLGLPQIGYFYGWGVGKNFLAVDTYWLKRLGEFWPAFLLVALGWLTSPKKLKKFAAPFWLLFLAALFFRFQPYNWDNSKFFIHWYLIAAIAAGAFFRRYRLIGLILLFLSIYPGIKDIDNLLRYDLRKYQFFNNEQLTLAEDIKNITPPRAVFLTAFNHNHWLPALTGRPIVMGYPGWLWTYGIDYLPRQKDVESMYQGNQNLLAQYGINYVVIGPDEQTTFSKINTVYFSVNFPLVLDRDGYKVFKLK